MKGSQTPIPGTGEQKRGGGESRKTKLGPSKSKLFPRIIFSFVSTFKAVENYYSKPLKNTKKDHHCSAIVP